MPVCVRPAISRRAAPWLHASPPRLLSLGRLGIDRSSRATLFLRRSESISLWIFAVTFHMYYSHSEIMIHSEIDSLRLKLLPSDGGEQLKKSCRAVSPPVVLLWGSDFRRGCFAPASNDQDSRFPRYPAGQRLGAPHSETHALSS